MRLNIKEKLYNFLIKTQKISQTDNIYLGRQGFYIGLNQAGLFLLGLLTSVVFARYVSKDVYGQYQYLFALMSLLGIASLRGINASLIRSIARGFEGSFIPALKKRFFWALGGSALALVMAGYYYFKHDQILTIGCLLIALFLPFWETATMYLDYWEGKKNFRQEAKLSVLAQSAYVLVVLLIIYFYPRLFPIFIGVNLTVIIVKWFFNYLAIKKARNQAVDHEMIKYGKHFSLMDVIGTVAQQLNQILIFHYIGPVQLAVYTFANLPQTQANSILSNLRTIAYPRLSENDSPVQVKAWVRKLLLLSALIVLGVILYLLIAPYLFQIFFPNYLDAVKYSRILFLLPLFFPITFLPLIFQARRMNKELYQFSVIPPLVQLALLFFLLPRFGLWGVVYSQLIAGAFSCLFTIYLFRKSFGQNPFQTNSN